MGTHVDVDQWNPVVVTDDGDPASQSAWREADEPLADRTFFLRKRVYAAEATDKMLQALVVPRDQADWDTLQSTAAPLGVAQNNAAGHLPLFIPVVHLPKNGKIVEIGMTIDPAGSHAGLPAQQPRLRLYRTDTGSSSAPALVATAQDAQGTVGAYELPHSVAATGLTEVVAHDSGNAYHFEITGEDSTNALAGMKVTSVWVVVDPS